MATLRLIPSAYSVSNTTYLTVADESNMYNNTDNTTYATITNTRSSTTSYYLYINGFNFSDIPSNATVNSFTVKIKCYESGLSTSSRYYMYLVNGTSTIGDYASTMPSTSVQTITFDNVSSTWDTISGYGSNFGIRLNCRRQSSNTTGYLYVYGAEILVDYTLPDNTVSATITGGTLLSDATATVASGSSYTVYFNPDDTNYDLLSMTVGGTDVDTALTKGVYITSNVLTTSDTTYEVSTNYDIYSTNALANAYDGNTDTLFWSNGAQTAGKYVLITFANKIHLNSFSTYSSNSTDYPNTCNVLQVSNDGSTWEDVGTFQASQTSTFSSIDKDCQYVRIYANSTISNWLVINEITMDYNDYETIDCYTYTISSVDADTAIVITYGIPDNAFYMKTGDSVWKRVSKIYKKTGAKTWEEVSLTDFNTFAADKKFIRLEIPSLPVGAISNSTNAININDDSLDTDTYTLYYEDENDKKLDGWSAIGTITKS